MKFKTINYLPNFGTDPMKTTPPQKVTGLLLLLLLVSAPLLAQRDTTFYPDGKTIRTLTITKDKKKDVQEFAENGKRTREVTYVDGKQDGVSRNWNSMGTLIQEAHYTNGLRDGKYTTWFADGKKQEEAFYVILDPDKKPRSVLNGKHTKYLPNGKTAKITTYKKGEKSGTEEEWYPGGTKKSQVTYAADKRFGSYTYWFENGKMGATGAYDTIHKASGSDRKRIDEVKTGHWKTWNKEGILLSEGTYKKGEEEGKHVSWYEDGTQKSEMTFRNGKAYGPQRTWFKNGQLQYVREQYYEYDSLHKKMVYRYEGRYEEYKEDGSPVKKGNYVKGKEHGHWTQYSRNVMYEEADYHHGMLINTYKVYHTNGKVMKEAHYDLFRTGNRDTTLLNGPYTEYHDNGAVRVRYTYKEGKLINEANKEFSKSGFVTREFRDEGPLMRKIEYTDLGVIKLQSIALKQDGISAEKLKYQGEKFYDENGKLRRKINYTDGKPQGYFVEWNESGKLLSEAYLFNPREDNPHPGNINNSWTALYYDNGQPWKEQYIRSAWATGYEIEWYITGQLKRVVQHYHFDAQWLQNGELFSLTFYNPEKPNQPKDTVISTAWADELYKQYSHPKNKMLRLENAPDGLQQSFYNDKQVRFETYIVNGKPDSVFRGYYPDGSLFMEWQLKDGLPHGRYIIMNGNNMVYESGSYCNGKACGEWVINQMNGKPYHEYGIDETGKRSYAKEYYPENGQLRSLYTYRNGKKYGVQKEWAPNGTLTGQYEMRNDTTTESFNWNDKGQPSRHTTYNSKGVKEGLEETWWHTTGKKASEVIYVNNKKEGPGKTWWPNGRLRGEGVYKNDLAEDYWMVYDSTGAPGKKMLYVKGEEQVPPSGNPCECTEPKRDIRFAPLLYQLVDSTHFPGWQFGYHEKIPVRVMTSLFYMDYQNSHNRNAMFNSMTLISYRDIEVGFPDKNGIRLVLTPCKSKVAQLHVNANTEKRNPDAMHLEFTPYRLALKFDERLLKPTDSKLKNSQASFTVKFMEYEQQGITLHQPKAVCFNESFIGKTGMRLTLDNFIPLLTAKENTTTTLLDSTWSTGSVFYTTHLQPHFRKNFNGMVNGNGMLSVPYANNATLLLPARGVTSNDQFVALELTITGVKTDDDNLRFKNNGKTISTSLTELKAHFTAKGFRVAETTATDEKTIRIQLLYTK